MQRTRGELQALRAILFPTLRATPSVPNRPGAGGEPVSLRSLWRERAALLLLIRQFG